MIVSDRRRGGERPFVAGHLFLYSLLKNSLPLPITQRSAGHEMPYVQEQPSHAFAEKSENIRKCPHVCFERIWYRCHPLF